MAARSLMWRAAAGMAKGLVMAGFGIGVLIVTAYRAFHPALPEATTMAVVAIITLVVNFWELYT